jgi:hypothetical protein
MQAKKGVSMIKRTHYGPVLLCGITILFAGCTQDTKKFPVQAATADDAKTEGYDALTDAGLLARTTAEKKVFIVASKQVNNYDLSAQGRSDWTPDTTQPGYGNFCFGHRAVDSIDSFTTGVNASGLKTAQVNYHYSFADVPAWAKNQEVQTAFSSAGAALAHSQPGQDSLVMNGTTWQVTK